MRINSLTYRQDPSVRGTLVKPRKNPYRRAGLVQILEQQASSLVHAGQYPQPPLTVNAGLL